MTGSRCTRYGTWFKSRAGASNQRSCNGFFSVCGGKWNQLSPIALTRFSLSETVFGGAPRAGKGYRCTLERVHSACERPFMPSTISLPIGFVTVDDSDDKDDQDVYG